MRISNAVAVDEAGWRAVSIATPASFRVAGETGERVTLVLSLSRGCRVVGQVGGRPVEGWSRVGAVSLIPPCCRYDKAMTGRSDALIVEVEWSEVRDWMARNGVPADGVEILAAQCVPDLRLAQGLLTLARGGAGALDDVIGSLLARHSNRASRTAGARARGGLTPRQMRRVAENVGDRLGASLTLDDMLAGVGVSKFHFIRAFKATAGVTPHQHLLNARLDRALEALLDGSLDVDLVAERTGFSHASHLSRMLKRRFGVTPGEFRRAVLPQSPRQTCPL